MPDHFRSSVICKHISYYYYVAQQMAPKYHFLRNVELRSFLWEEVHYTDSKSGFENDIKLYLLFSVYTIKVGCVPDLTKSSSVLLFTEKYFIPLHLSSSLHMFISSPHILIHENLPCLHIGSKCVSLVTIMTAASKLVGIWNSFFHCLLVSIWHWGMLF